MFDQSGEAAGRGGSRGRSPIVRIGRSPRVARADRVVGIRRAELRIEALVLRDAADWAIQHGVDPEDPCARGPAGGVGKQVGSDGTPWIDQHVGKEYGALRGTSTFEATDLIIDALDLRHRFPRLWRAVHAGQIRVRYARKISKACRDLSLDAAALVDAELACKAAWGLPWARLEKILAAAIMNADPALHKKKLEAAKFDRRVWLSASEDGLRTMIIRADAGDQVLLYALIDRIADILAVEGDTDRVDARRSKAVGWLSRPEDLTVLLYKHASPASRPGQSGTDHAHTGCSADQGDDGDESAGSESGVADDADTDGEFDPSDSSGEDGDVGVQGRSADTDRMPQPPDDFPEPDWDRPEPPYSPGVSDRLPTPWTRSRNGAASAPEPYPPAWCYQPSDDPGHAGDPPPPPDPQTLNRPGVLLGCNVPRLIDYLTAAGLKPATPRVIVNVHLTDQTLQSGEGVVRVDDSGPILLSQLLDLLGRHRCQISLRPVLDPANLAAVDAYETPDTLRAAVRTRHPASVFPFSSRHGSRLELDHTVPHTHTAEPAGQTRIGNLGPLARIEHQAKTDGVWHVEQAHPGVFLWRSPHQHYFLVTNHGTQPLGPMPAPRPSLPGPTVITLARGPATARSAPSQRHGSMESQGFHACSRQ